MSYFNSRTGRTHLFIFLFFFGFNVYLQRDVLLSVTLDKDEIFTWLVISKDWESFAIDIFNDSQKFLYFFLMKLWKLVIPVENDYWIRVPSLVFSSLSVSIFYFILSRFLPVSSSVIGTFLYSRIPAFVHFASFNRPYSLLFLLATLNILSVYYLLNSKRRNLSEWFFLGTLILLLETHYLSSIYSLALFLSLYALRINLGHKRLGLLLAYSVIYFLQLFYQWKHSIGLISWIDSKSISFANILEFYFFSRSFFHFSIYLIIGLVFLFVACWKKNFNKLITFNLLTVCLGTLLLGIFSHLVSSISLPRYYLFFLPYFFLAVSYGIHHFIKAVGVYWLILPLFLDVSPVNKDRFSYREDIKSFFIKIKNENLISSHDRVLCLYKDVYTGSFSIYSQMHFNKDICWRHKPYSDLQGTEGFNTILYVQDSNLRDSESVIINHFSLTYGDSDLKIFKRK